MKGGLITPVYATLPPPVICSPAPRDAIARIRAQSRKGSQMLDAQEINQSGPDMGLLEDWISRYDLAISLRVSEDAPASGPPDCEEFRLQTSGQICSTRTEPLRG
jgi:hypothetical protein